MLCHSETRCEKTDTDNTDKDNTVKGYVEQFILNHLKSTMNHNSASVSFVCVF